MRQERWDGIVIERFLLESRKAKIKVIYSGQSKRRQTIQRTNQNLNCRKYTQPASSAGKSVRASHDCFGFTSDWLRKWREIVQLKTKRSIAKRKQSPNDFQHSVENLSISTN